MKTAWEYVRGALEGVARFLALLVICFSVAAGIVAGSVWTALAIGAVFAFVLVVCFCFLYMDDYQPSRPTAHSEWQSFINSWPVLAESPRR